MSPGSDGDPNPLITLFRQCVICVTDEVGQFSGSGFFVAPGRVVTCGHVAHGATALRVHWQGQVAGVVAVAAVPPLASVSNPADYPLPDLAVLELNSATNWDHPCIGLLAEPPVLAESSDALYLAGFTVEHGGNPVLTGAATEFESSVREDGHTIYKVKRGQLLPGFSGSPLLNMRTGLVSGIVESSRGRHAELGGFAVPITELAAAFPEVFEANRRYHAEDAGSRWTKAIEAERKLAAGRAGKRARLPLRRPVVRLGAGADVSPATLLRPRHAVVGYVGREQLLLDLGDWCEAVSTGPWLKLWFVTGAGGFGKTRLAVEACVEAEARGWTTGLLRPEVSDAALQDLAEWPGRLLVAIGVVPT